MFGRGVQGGGGGGGGTALSALPDSEGSSGSSDSADDSESSSASDIKNVDVAEPLSPSSKENSLEGEGEEDKESNIAAPPSASFAQPITSDQLDAIEQGEATLAPVSLSLTDKAELLNGRLAMVGFVAALGAETKYPQLESIRQQFYTDPWLILAFVAITTGLTFYLPVVLAERGLVGVDASADKQKQALSQGTVAGEYGDLIRAERLNGRLAMLAFALIFSIESLRNGQEAFPFLEDLFTYFLPRAFVGEAIDIFFNIRAHHTSNIEDAYLLLLTAASLFCLGQMTTTPRKSRSIGTDIHIATGALQFVLALYAVLLQRVYREVPGWDWHWMSLAACLASCATVGPLMKYYKGPRVYQTLFKLGQDFVISFQGIQLTAWSARPDAPEWMYWAVQPFWFWSILKLYTSAQYAFALSPMEWFGLDETTADRSKQGENVNAGPLGSFALKCRSQLDGMQRDAPTYIYVGLNTAAALFDNAWMFLYTVKGPEAFWQYSRLYAPNDLSLSLIKPAAGSLTVSAVVFLGTLAARRKVPAWLAGALNVMLASVGPWLILFWHRLVDPSEAWFPQFMPLP